MSAVLGYIRPITQLGWALAYCAKCADANLVIFPGKMMPASVTCDAEQALMPAGSSLPPSIASPDMIEAELARPTPQRALSMQRPIAACSEGDLRRELEAAVAEGLRRQGSERTA